MSQTTYNSSDFLQIIYRCGEGKFISSADDNNPITENETCADFVNYVMNEPKLKDLRSYILMNLSHLDYLYVERIHAPSIKAEDYPDPEYNPANYKNWNASKWINKSSYIPKNVFKYHSEIMDLIEKEKSVIVAFSLKRPVDFFKYETYDCWAFDCRIKNDLTWNYLIRDYLKNKLIETKGIVVYPSEINDPFDAVYWLDDLFIDNDYKVEYFVNDNFKCYYKGFVASLSLLDEYSDYVDAVYAEFTKQHPKRKSFSMRSHPLNMVIAKHFIDHVENRKDFSDSINECVKELNKMIEEGLINEKEFYC